MDNKKTQDKIKEEIMRELGLDKLSSKKQDDILVKMGEIILKKIFIETVNRLNEPDRKSFKEMLDKGSSAEDIEMFLTARISDYDKMVDKIINELKDEMKGNS